MAIPDCALYQPRQPQATPLYHLVASRYADVRDGREERFESRYGFWRAAAERGLAWTPALSTGLVFADVPIDYWAGDFIEALAAEGITGGCGGGLNCPDSPVTRAEMAVFLTATFSLRLY